MTGNIKLHNGYEMPNIGFGTFQIGEIEIAIKNALQLGYRHFDCAWIYSNEKEIGTTFEESIKNGLVERKNLFITSKLWNAFHRPENVSKGFNETLTNLKLEYLDLYLIHWPLAIKFGNKIPPRDTYQDEIDDVDFLDTWKAMENLVDSGKVRSIGVSNFNIPQIQRILDHCRIKPAVNQIELHIHLKNKKLVDFCLNHGIQITAYSPLGGAFDRPVDELRPLDDPDVLRIANNLSITPGQVLISYIINRGLSCIPKSVSPVRMKQNLHAASIKLSDEDYNALHNNKTEQRKCAPKVFELDKNYPFWED